VKCCATDTKIIGSTLIHALYSTLCLIIIFSQIIIKHIISFFQSEKNNEKKLIIPYE